MDPSTPDPPIPAAPPSHVDVADLAALIEFKRLKRKRIGKWKINLSGRYFILLGWTVHQRKEVFVMEFCIRRGRELT